MGNLRIVMKFEIEQIPLNQILAQNIAYC